MRIRSLALLAALSLLLVVQVIGSDSQAKGDNMKTGQAKSFRIFNPDSLGKPTAGYSHVADVEGGHLVYIAGQVALDRSGNLVGPGDFKAQVQ